MDAVHSYYKLTKPGIIFGNAVTCVGGFALASRSGFDWQLFVATLVGLSFVVASACVFNNVIDREHDQKMARTRNRALAMGRIPVGNALFFGASLLVVGVAVLSFFSHWAAALYALLGFVGYVFVYSYLKYKTVHGTLIGSIAGALPPVVGYAGAVGHVDWWAFVIFLMIVTWQMPHFFAIAIFRMRDYGSAGVPVLPLVRGVYATKVQMLLYTVAYVAVSALLIPYLGWIYAACTLSLGAAWIVISLRGFWATNDGVWARKMFIFSLLIVVAVCASLIVS
ncbi:MAG: heme o synthase [Simkaniaceae bacterium]|nr:heme o synthase [Simkaniaceae bacterium]